MTTPLQAKMRMLELGEILCKKDSAAKRAEAEEREASSAYDLAVDAFLGACLNDNLQTFSASQELPENTRLVNATTKPGGKVRVIYTGPGTDDPLGHGLAIAQQAASPNDLIVSVRYQ